MEKEMATHSSIFAWTEEPGGLQPMGFQGVGHIVCTHVFRCCPGEEPGRGMEDRDITEYLYLERWSIKHRD